MESNIAKKNNVNGTRIYLCFCANIPNLPGNAALRQQEVVVRRRLLLLDDVHDSEDAD